MNYVSNEFQTNYNSQSYLFLMGKGKRAHTISSAPAITSLVSIPRRASGDLVFSLTPSNFLARPTSLQPPPPPLLPLKPPPTLRWTPHTQPKHSYDELEHKLESAPLVTLVLTYLNWFILILLGHLRDFCGKRFKPGEYRHLQVNEVKYSNAFYDNSMAFHPPTFLIDTLIH